MGAHQKELSKALNLISDAIYKPSPNNDGLPGDLEKKIDLLIEMQSKHIDPDRLIQIEEVCMLCGFEKSKIYNLIKEDGFPEPKKFGRASRWKLSEIQTWIAMQ